MSVIGDCCENLTRFLFFAFNLVFVITGLALVILGAYVQVEASNYDFLGPEYENTPILFIIVGVIIFVIASLGVYGACARSHCAFFAYSVLVLVIFIIEIGAGIAAVVFRDQLKEVMEDNMQEAIDNYDVEGHEAAAASWDLVQETFECCGVNSKTDWNRTGAETPKSCDCTAGPGCDEDQKWMSGCASKLEAIFSTNIDKIAIAAFIIAIIELFGVILSCYIAKRFKATGETV